MIKEGREKMRKRGSKKGKRKGKKRSRDGKYESETERHGLQNEIVLRTAEGMSRIREGKI